MGVNLFIVYVSLLYSHCLYMALTVRLLRDVHTFTRKRLLLLFNDYVSTADFLECQMQRGMIVDSISKALDVAVRTLLEEIAW